MLVPDFLDALVARLDTVDGVTGSTDPSATIVAGLAVVNDEEITYHEAMMPRGLYRVAFTVTVYTSRADSKSGLTEARQFRSNHGDHSIARAIETSLGTSDALDGEGSVIVNTGSADVTTRASGETWHTLVFEGSAHITGA